MQMILLISTILTDEVCHGLQFCLKNRRSYAGAKVTCSFYLMHHKLLLLLLFLLLLKMHSQKQTVYNGPATRCSEEDNGKSKVPTT